MKGMDTQATTHKANAAGAKKVIHNAASKVAKLSDSQLLGRAQWNIPPRAVAATRTVVQTPARRNSKSSRDAYNLSDDNAELLEALKQRCESSGVKIKKTQLIVAALHLLTSMPMGKFLAAIGPHESALSPPFKAKNKERAVRRR